MDRVSSMRFVNDLLTYLFVHLLTVPSDGTKGLPGERECGTKRGRESMPLYHGFC